MMEEVMLINFCKRGIYILWKCLFDMSYMWFIVEMVGIRDNFLKIVYVCLIVKGDLYRLVICSYCFIVMSVIVFIVSVERYLLKVW